MAIGTDVKAPYYILGADGNYHKLLNENIVEQIEGVGRRPATAYEVGDVVASSTNSKVLLLCTQAGTTAETDLSIAGKNTGDVVTDGMVTWEVIDRRITFNNLPNKPTTLAGYGITDAGLPVGHEFFTTNPNIPAGCIPLLGGEYSRTAYADLWAWVQTQNGYLIEESAWQTKAAANGGNVPFYSKGNGTTTFRVPALKCWVKGANSISEIGGYLAAGLPDPNINFLYRQDAISSGVYVDEFGNDGLTADVIDTVDADEYMQSSSASGARTPYAVILENPIYGASDTVQPPSIVGLWCAKAYGTVTNVGSTDVSNIASGLTLLETRFDALSNNVDDINDYVVDRYVSDTKWWRKWKSGWLEQGAMEPLDSNGSALVNITLLQPFIDTNYSCFITGTRLRTISSSDAFDFAACVGNKTTTKFAYTFQAIKTPVAWYACGQGA